MFSKKLEEYYSILNTKNAKIFVSRNIKSMIFLIINKLHYCFLKYSDIQQRIIYLIEKEKDNNSIYVDNAVFPAYKRKRFEKELIKSAVKKEFEGNYFNAPIGYDKILQIIYGDYMQLPPEEQRIPHHGFTAYWKD